MKWALSVAKLVYYERAQSPLKHSPYIFSKIITI